MSQQVSGSAHSRDSGLPLEGVAILLVGNDNAISVAALTDVNGTYRLVVPSPGQYRVRARRLGFSPDSSEQIAMAAGAEIKYNPIMIPIVFDLVSVRVESTRPCGKRGQTDVNASDLWEAAQNALSTTLVASGGSAVEFELERFTREVDPGSGEAIRQAIAPFRAKTSEPYYSLPPDSLSLLGFARVDGDSSVYFAPDAHTLTSDVFTRTHCLRVISSKDKPTDIGLAFEPTNERRVVDVSGVLWLDRKTGNLESLDFRYVLPRVTRFQKVARGVNYATGHVEYRRLDNGAWIVDNWVIAIPLRNNGISTRWEFGGRVAALRPPVEQP